MVLPVIARMAAVAAAKQVGKAGAKRASKEAAKQADKAKEEAFRNQTLMPGQAKTGTRAARDTKEPTEYTPEVSGRMRFRRQDEDVAPGDRTPRMSDDYKKGGAVKSSASKRADGCAQRGKTRA